MKPTLVGRSLWIAIAALSLPWSSSAFASADGDYSVPTFSVQKGKYDSLAFPDEAAFRAATGIPAQAPAGSLANDRFTIVMGSSGEPATIADKHGRSALFHLMAAHRFFEALDPANPALARRGIVVRIHQEQGYSFVNHFSAATSVNSSRYIPGNYRGQWGAELWFHPRHKNMPDWLIVAAAAGGSLFQPWAAASLPLAIASNHRTGLDTALEPSVVYHEAFHYASDRPDWLAISAFPNPLAEDLANYFAAVINHHPVVASRKSDKTVQRNLVKIARVTTTRPKGYNFTSFVPSILWSLREKSRECDADGASATPGDFDRMVWRSIPRLAATTSYRELARALPEALEEQGLSPELSSELRSILADQTESFANLDLIFGRRP